METRNFLKALLQTSAITAIAMGTAVAQEANSQDTTPEAETEIDEIVVTGSRIKRDAFTSDVTMDILTVESAKIEGIADIGGLLQTATAASGSSQVTSAVSTAFVQNGGLGAENVGLRGLQANRTLDLINSRRAGPSGTRGSVSSFDLGSIPLVGVERVDILKDGASSVYGSDAIAGVINYITDKSDGAEIDLFTQIPENGGGEIFRGSATYGKTFDKGRFRITGDYFKEKELARKDRSYLDCNENYSFTDASLTTRADVIDPRTGKPQCGGTIWGHVWVYDYGSDNLAQNPRNIILQHDRGNNLAQYIPGIPTSLDGSGITTPPGWFQVEYFQDDLAGLAPFAGVDVSNNNQNAVTDLYPEMQRNNSVIPERERYTFMFDGDYELTDSITAYGEALFNRRTNYANAHKQFWTYQFGESAAVFGGGANTNPASAGWTGDNTWFSPTGVVDHGDEETKIDYFRLVGGLKGDFGDAGPFPGWSWDVYAQHSDSKAKYTEQFVRQDSIQDFWFATGPCTGSSSGATGEDGASIEGVPCVDVRWFDPDFLAGNLTQAERDFLLTEDTGKTDYTQTTVEGFVSGGVFDLPAGKLSAALGYFFQRDEILDRPSDTILSGNGFGESNAGITTGVQSTNAIYAELSIPLVKDKPLFEDVSVSLSGRFSEITSKNEDGRTATEDGFNYRATANWRVSDAVRFRGSLGTSFRTPGLFEQFLADESSNTRQSLIDPCIGWANALQQGDITEQTATNCAADGIPDDYSGAPIAANIFQGGGFGFLQPETSKNYTAGVVLTPSFADLSIAVDYFDITINDEISTLSARQIVSGCYNSDDFANEPLCDLFNRGVDNTGAFRIDSVFATFINVNSQVNSGIDFTLRYRKDTKWGDFDFDTQWSHQLKDEIRLLAEDSVKYLNGGVGEPKWTGLANLTYSPNDNLLFRYGINYIGSQNGLRNRFSETKDLSTLLEPDGGYTVQQDGQTVYWKTKLEPTIYHSLSAQYSTDSGWTVRAGVNNLFDEHPPFTSSDSIRGNAPIVSQYDLRGRRAFLNVSKKFD